MTLHWLEDEDACKLYAYYQHVHPCGVADVCSDCEWMLQMLLEAQRMWDAVLESKVNMAISSNRLTRLDNPIVHDKLRALAIDAEDAMKLNDHEE